MSRGRIHAVFLFLLRECLALSDEHRGQVESAWGVAGEDVDRLLIRSAPSPVFSAVVMPEIEKVFDYDLRGVPGFYYARALHPRDELAELCDLPPLGEPDYRWNLNLPKTGLVKPYFNDGKIAGLFVYEHPAVSTIGLLSSQGLNLGTTAIKPSRFTDRKA